MEAMLIGKKFGLSPETIVDVLNASTGINNSTQKRFKQHVLSGTFRSGFGLDLLVKDIGIALSLAQATEMNIPFSRLCEEIWASAASAFGPGHDHTEVAKYQAKVAGSHFLERGL